MSRDQVKNIVKAFAKELRRQDFPFTQIFLYGSYATGKATSGSDIDVCVVSKKFSGNKGDAYERKLWVVRRVVDSRIEPIGMTPEDLKSWSPLAHEIRKTGVKIV